MPSYEYTAVNATGQAESGTVLGMTLSDAAKQLADKGLQVEKINVAEFVGDSLANSMVTPPPVEVPRAEQATVQPPPVAQEGLRDAPPTEARSYVATNVVGPLVGRVGLNQLMFFFRQFAAMVEAGVPMVQTLETLTKQTHDPRLKHVINEMKGHVLEGRGISTGMQRYPEVFSPLHVSLIRAGEEGGFLADASKQVANYIEQDVRIRNQYKRALFMPKITVIGSIVIILAANFIIGWATGGKGQGINSPLTTIAVWVVLGPILVGAFLFFRVGLANPRIKYNWDRILLSVPYLGNTLQQFAMAKFGRAFGALYSGGVNIPKAVQLSADACGNEYLRAQIHPTSKRLETGDQITETMRSTGAFTPLVLDMMHTGETTGNLDSMLNKVSDYYEDEAEVRAQQLGKVVGVAAMVLVGAYVGYVVITFYMKMVSGYGLESAGDEP
ncbi:MAG: type II secretion system F family protein [Chlorobia bacterium]|nr:type II secretion system F family protein [Fimbriimonadaceae bacterium]